MKKIIFSIIALLLVSPGLVNAEEIDSNLGQMDMISQTTKYYKTVTNTYQTLALTQNNNSTTTEISKAEYDAVDVDEVNNLNGTGSVETTYKKLTTAITRSGSKYRYATSLNWKIFPQTRSYDVIAIGFPSNVRYSGMLDFKEYYCNTNNVCTNYTSGYTKTSSSGAGVAFKLPTGGLTVLTARIAFDVDKSTNSTVTSQYAYGDYSHATSNVNTTQAQSYTIGTNGITFTNGVSAYYDAISSAIGSWTGSW